MFSFIAPKHFCDHFYEIRNPLLKPFFNQLTGCMVHGCVGRLVVAEMVKTLPASVLGCCRSFANFALLCNISVTLRQAYGASQVRATQAATQWKNQTEFRRNWSISVYNVVVYSRSIR
jgi:hypothetical protein